MDVKIYFAETNTDGIIKTKLTNIGDITDPHGDTEIRLCYWFGSVRIVESKMNSLKFGSSKVACNAISASDILYF